MRPHALALAAAAGVILLAASAAAPAESPTRGAKPGPGIPAGLLGPLLAAEVAVRRGDESDAERAVRSFLNAARTHESPALAERATRLAARAGRFDEAADAAALWRSLEPGSRDAHHAHALMLARTDRVAEAAAELRSIAAQSAEPGRTGHEEVLEVLRHVPDPVVRVRLMEEVADAGSEARFALARVAAQARQSERAMKLLEVLRRERPEDGRFAVAHALLLRGRGDLDAALDVLAAHEGPGEPGDEVLHTHANLLVGAGRTDEAITKYEALLERDPDDLDARWELGRLLTRMERYEEARSHFRELRRSPSWRNAAWYFTGLIDESQSDPDRALRAYRKVRDGRYYANARIRTAEILAESGQIQWARWHLAVTPRYTESDDIQLYRAESSLLFRAERIDEAMAVLDNALDSYPEHPDLLYTRAMAAERIDRLDILERDLRSIIERDPDHAEALNALGYTLADRTDRYEEAYDLVERAFALEPDLSHIVDSMGWVLYRLGRHAEAAEHLRRSYELEPDPVVAAHLGEVLWALGHRDEARELWDSALEHAPDNEVLLETIERFGT